MVSDFQSPQATSLIATFDLCDRFTCISPVLCSTFESWVWCDSIPTSICWSVRMSVLSFCLSVRVESESSQPNNRKLSQVIVESLLLIFQPKLSQLDTTRVKVGSDILLKNKVNISDRLSESIVHSFEKKDTSYKYIRPHPLSSQ